MHNKMKLKIGFFIPYFFPAWRFGGPVKSTYELGKRLVQKGHQVNIYCTDVSNNHKKRIEKKKDIIDGMNVFYFKNLSNHIASKYKIFLPFDCSTLPTTWWPGITGKTGGGVRPSISSISV